MITNQLLESVVSQYRDKTYSKEMAARITEIGTICLNNNAFLELIDTLGRREGVSIQKSGIIFMAGLIIGMDLENMRKN